MLSILRKHSLSRIQYGIVNPKIYHGKSDVKHDPKLRTYSFYGMRNNRSGVIIFNKPNFQNKLNFEGMEEMYRFLKSYETDENIQHIWVENKGNSCFSNGIDYDLLVKSPKYLHRIFQLGIMMSRLNKPVFGYVKGLVGGTAAYLLKYLSTPFGDKNTHLKLHDIDQHFIPICGGSYLLSRLNGKLGTYLALTGDTMDANDMVGSGFIYALLRRDYSEEELRKAAGEKSNIGSRYFTHDTFDYGRSKLFDDKYLEETAQIDYAESAQIMNMEIMQSKNKELRVARLADVAYKTLQVGLENLKKPYQRVPQEHIIDHFHQKEECVLKQFETKYIQPHKGEVVRGFPVLAIDRIFKYDTIEEIISALKKEGTEWARSTIKKLESKDPLALKLNLRLIKQASNSTFSECLQREYRVASKLRLHEPFIKFHAGEETPKKHLSEITAEAVSKFFEKNNEHHQLQHDIVPHSILPVKQYRHNLPDSVRFFLNRQYWNDPNREGQKDEVFRWLRKNQISAYNDSWSLDDLRRRVYLSHRNLGKLKEHMGKIDRMYYNHTAEAKFKQSRVNYIEEIFAKDNIQSLIDQKVKENFNKRFHSRMAEMKPTADIFAKEQKGKLYSAIRDILVKKRLTENVGEDKPEQVLGIASFEPNGKGKLQSPEFMFKGTPFEHLINASDSNGKIVGPLPNQYFDMLDEQVNESEVEPLATMEGNPHLIEALRRYETGMYFYSVNNNRKDLEWVKQISQYSDKVKEMFENYSQQELKSIFSKQDKYTWRHLLKEIETTEENTLSPTIDADKIAKVPDYSQIYDLSNDASPLVESIHIELPQQFNVPPQLQQRSNKLLQLITSKILNNLGDWNSSSLDNKVPLFDNWVRETIKLDVIQFLKGDCHFVFSYFMIKDIEAIVKRLGNVSSDEELISRLEEIGIKFESAEEVQSVFSKYLTDLAELYSTSAQSILLKNSKLLEMHNRIKTNEQVEVGYPEMDKLLIEIGKLRLKLKERNNPNSSVINYDAQFNIQTLVKDEFQDRDLFTKRTQLSITANAYDTKFKRLVKGYESYISRIDFMFKKINSTTDYLPDTLANLDNLEQFNKLTQDIDENEELDTWFERKLNEAVEVVFNHRLEAEKHLSTQELKLFDEEIMKALEPDNIKHLLYEIMENDISTLVTFKREHTRSLEKGYTENEELNPRRFIRNQQAFRKLTNLSNTIDVIESRELANPVMERYQGTIMRLLEESVTDKKPSKPLDEKELQRANFTTTDRIVKTDTSDINFIRGELKVLTTILDEDEDMIELSKVLG